MALIRWRGRELEPMDTFDWLQRQINELFDVPRFPESRGVFDRAVSPPVDVVETPDAFVVQCDLPGIDQKAVDLTIADNVLTIKGEKKAESEDKGRRIYRKETWEGSFQRTVSLPSLVDADKVEATFRNGVLKVTIPKREEAKAKRIELRSK